MRTKCANSAEAGSILNRSSSQTHWWRRHRLEGVSLPRHLLRSELLQTKFWGSSEVGYLCWLFLLSKDRCLVLPPARREFSDSAYKCPLLPCSNINFFRNANPKAHSSTPVRYRNTNLVQEVPQVLGQAKTQLRSRKGWQTSQLHSNLLLKLPRLALR